MTEIPPLVEIFSDRIVITSSGGLPQALTINEFFSGISAPRNKELMRIFKDLKLAEQIGSGMRRILSVYDRSAFEVSENFLRVTFYYDTKATFNVTNNVINNVTKSIRLNSTQQKIINAVEHNKNVTTSELASMAGITKRQILRNIKKLTGVGLLGRIGTHRTGSWVINESDLAQLNEEKELFEAIAPLAKQLQALYKKIDKMLADGLITREQYDEMTWEPEDDDE